MITPEPGVFPPVRNFPAIMFQGTGSDVGKSLLVAGIARALTRRGLKVCPFKPQNMSNNAAVTRDGGEIGRAQALQARACGVRPTSDMNPVLLKPQSHHGSQVIVQGQVWGTTGGGAWWQVRQNLMPRILESFLRLGQEADLVLVEGAGSAAEVNLRRGDIANMGFAEAANLPVVLIADIDRGGVIASVIGTHAVLTQQERARVVGVIINKFRGQLALFQSGLDMVTRKTGFASLGVVPFFNRARLLPDEDSVQVQSEKLPSAKTGSAKTGVQIAVPLLPRISNLDDFDPLIAEPFVDLRFIHPGDVIPAESDLVILPGSKATIADLDFLRAQGWDIDLLAHARRGGHVFGMCGGYQMLGDWISDPLGLEGPPARVQGLGLLPVETELRPDKILREVTGLELMSKTCVRGYEIHSGQTRVSDHKVARPLLELEGRPDGVSVENGRIAGCYLHGFFTQDDLRTAFLTRIKSDAVACVNFDVTIDLILDELADHLEEFCDLERILKVARDGV